MNEQYTMRPGDTFAAKECGCSFMVETGPSNESMVKQAPQCCCGHSMVKQPSAAMNAVTTSVNEPVGEVDVAGA